MLLGRCFRGVAHGACPRGENILSSGRMAFRLRTVAVGQTDGAGERSGGAKEVPIDYYVVRAGPSVAFLPAVKNRFAREFVNFLRIVT